MNRTLMWVVGVIGVIFVGLIVVGTIAIKGISKDIKEIEDRQKKSEEYSDIHGNEDSIYGEGNGGIHDIDEGITWSVHSIEYTRQEGLAGVQFAVRNETKDDYYLNKSNMYLKDETGNKYYMVDAEDETMSDHMEVFAYSTYEIQKIFRIPSDYSGDFEGWLLVYEGEQKTIEVEVRQE